MEISEYENIEIFNNTQGFDINKCENQILRQCEPLIKTTNGLFNSLILAHHRQDV
jgi:hypothetical protein